MARRRAGQAAPEAPPVAGAVTEEQANKVIKDAQEARAKGKPVDVPIEDGEAKSLAPKDTLDRSVRDALISVSRLNLSKIAQSNPNEIMMQDVAAILAKLNMPLLDKAMGLVLVLTGLLFITGTINRIGFNRAIF